MDFYVSLFGGVGRADFDDRPSNLVEVGDRSVPSRIVATFPGNLEGPDLSLTIEVRQGIPVYTELVLRSQPGSPDVRNKYLANIHLDDWLEAIVAACSRRRVGPNTWVGEADNHAAVVNVRQARAGRPRLAPEHLVRVAEIYREHVAGRPTEAVKRAFGVSDRTAARYVQAARKAGILPPTTPGKKKA